MRTLLLLCAFPIQEPVGLRGVQQRPRGESGWLQVQSGGADFPLRRCSTRPIAAWQPVQPQEAEE